METDTLLVKICGITRLEDARAAVDAGAQALGFVFWPTSPRFVDPYRARAIVAALPPFVTTVGLFVNQSIDYVNGVASLVRLGAVQLHGDETPSYATGIARPIIKAVAVTASTDSLLDGWDERVTVLLDAHDPARRGGTSQTVDWTQASAIAARRRTLLAGGLTPENIVEAIARVRPFGVDVSSGVESSPGIKNHGRLAALFDAVRSATAERVRRGGGAPRTGGKDDWYRPSRS